MSRQIGHLSSNLGWNTGPEGARWAHSKRPSAWGTLSALVAGVRAVPSCQWLCQGWRPGAGQGNTQLLLGRAAEAGRKEEVERLGSSRRQAWLGARWGV